MVYPFKDTIDRVFTNFLVVHTNENVCVHIIIILCEIKKISIAVA
jgi:hypothetical protein